MEAKEAREIINDDKGDGQLPIAQLKRWYKAKGYLEALSGKEVQALVDTAALVHELLCRDVRVGGSLIQELGRKIATFRDASPASTNEAQTGSAKK